MNPIVDAMGNKRWFNEKGILHREDGPAVECLNGSKCWYINGLRHREDGPAIEYTNGEKYWYYHGKQINSQAKFERIIKLKMFW